MGLNQIPPGLTPITPEEVLFDPVQKLRVSQPQSLIDTDFEYGTQISKWENLTTVGARPFIFDSTSAIETITAITMNTSSRTVTVSLTNTTGLSVGTPITVRDTQLSIANGAYLIESISTNTSFTYTGKAVNTGALTSIFDANKTAIFTGVIFTNAQIGGAPTVSYSGNAVTITTTIPHGLSIGNEVAITGITTSGSNPPNGANFVSRIISSTQFVIHVPVAPTGTLTASSAAVYVAPSGNFLHRPFDGGVIFSNNGTSNYELATRQTRRYFRYQSGKGIQMSSGTLLKPDLQLDQLNYDSSANLVTVQTKEKHNLYPGSTITIFGANEAIFNGTTSVYTITGYNTFTYQPATSSGTNILASGPYYITVSGWYGNVNRIGLFDDQNGVFFEFDGQTLWAVKRSSTFQISGKSSFTNGSCTVTQTSTAFPTRYAGQLEIGDYIVARGMSYRITDIASNTELTISPAWRGASSTMVSVSQTVDTKYPQAEWNLDKFDGTGASGYNVDLSRMQMFYIDYSWYGAGFIRWGMRAKDGKVTYCHKIINNNTNAEAYMRSGNLPARYESLSQPPHTQLTGTLSDSETTTMDVGSTTGFPSIGTLLVFNTATGYEYINYSGKTATTFTGLTRQKTGNPSFTLTIVAGANDGTVASNAGLQVGQRITGTHVPDGTFIQQIDGNNIKLSAAVTGENPTVSAIPMGTSEALAFTYSASNPVGVELAFPTYAPSISHWGTSAIMDGRFDDDKSLVFTYGQTSSLSIPSGATRTLIGIRVSPSADNGTSAFFGERELINRMQLVLRSLDVTTTSNINNVLITAILNGTPSNARTWTKPYAITSSLAQIADYAGTTTTVEGGEVTGGFFVGGTGGVQINLNTVRDLGNSILGGGNTLTTSGIYPDGPDTIHIVARNIGGSTANVFARISWTEAQA
jgi:hypothetical protein